MSKRHPQKPDVKSEFALWVKDHADLVAAAGLPSLIVSNEDRWYYFLEHNTLYYFDDDPLEFSIEKLAPLQRAAFMRLLLTWPNLLDSQVGRLLMRALAEDVENAYSG
jgi:hypothetical protein